MKAMKKHFLFMLPVASLLAAALLSSCSSSDDDVTGGTDPVKPEPALDHAIADLGLPSGTLWATTNVGATSPEGYGDFFAWGETTGYTSSIADVTRIGDYYAYIGYTDRSFNWASYTKFGTYDSSASPDYGFTKYNKTNGPTTLDATDDAAAANWGSAWRMPTEADWRELLKAYPESTISGNKRRAWIVDYNNTGVAGMAFYDASDNILLFLPAAGYRGDTVLGGQGAQGDYWSSSLSSSEPQFAWDLDFDSRYSSMGGDYRFSGCSVRPVLAQ